MVGYFARSVYALMTSPVPMACWIMLAAMVYLLFKRAHRYRKQGTVRLFATCAIMAVALPAVTAIGGWVLAKALSGQSREIALVLAAPIVVCLAFGLAVSLIQRFLGADAETALGLSWPIVLITYVIPLAFAFLLSIFQIGWLTGKSEYP